MAKKFCTTGTCLSLIHIFTDGELTIECGEDVQKITKGEIYRFETDKKHNYKNETQQKTSFICVFVDYR